MPYTYGDTAFLIETLSNLASGAPATSSMLAQNAAEIELARVDLSVYCQKGLEVGQFSSDPYHLFSLHAYVILYLIVPFVRLFGALNALSMFTALTFASIPGIAYVFLRKNGIPVYVAILAALICIIHPAWRISSGGQFYVDRFFISFALLYAILLYHYFALRQDDTDHLKVIFVGAVVTGVIGGLTSERNMLILSMFSMTYALAVKSATKRKAFIIGFSAICIAYVFLYFHLYGGTPDNARVQKSLFSVASLINAITRPGMGEYLWFNLILLLFPAVFAPRMLIAVAPILAINCFITVGGAEKNGWLTHYHSHYYGFLIAAFLIAIANTNCNTFSRVSALFHKFLFPILICLALSIVISFQRHYKDQGIFISLWDYYGRSQVLSGSLTHRDLFDKLDYYHDQGIKISPSNYHSRPQVLSASRTQIDMFDNIVDLVPVGMTITTTEWGMAAWYLHGNKVNLFPLGVGSNDYIMVQAEGEIPNIKLYSAVRYRADAIQANECFASIISDDYEKLSQQGTWVLFKKKCIKGHRKQWLKYILAALGEHQQMDLSGH
jgi:hypothetical protein